MKTKKITTSRIFLASPEKVYKAFTDLDALTIWLSPYGFVCKVLHLDIKTSGSYKVLFTNFTTGSKQLNTGEYLDVIPNEYIKCTNVLEEPLVPGKMIITFEFKKIFCGTELIVNQKDIPKSIPYEICLLNWQESFDKLKQLMEPALQYE